MNRLIRRAKVRMEERLGQGRLSLYSTYEVRVTVLMCRYSPRSINWLACSLFPRIYLRRSYSFPSYLISYLHSVLISPAKYF